MLLERKAAHSGGNRDNDTTRTPRGPVFEQQIAFSTVATDLVLGV